MVRAPKPTPTIPNHLNAIYGILPLVDSVTPQLAYSLVRVTHAGQVFFHFW